MMITAAMLALIEEAGAAVLVLVDGVEELEFARSRLTRFEVVRQLLVMADLLDSLPDSAQRAMPEIDWAGWRLVALTLRSKNRPQADTAWVAATAMVPATLSWLRVYRRAEPALFEFKPTV